MRESGEKEKARERYLRRRDKNPLRLPLPIDTSEERWRSVVGFEDKYMISDLGRVFSLFRRRYLLTPLSHQGYPHVMLYAIPRKGKWKLVAFLVAAAFIGPRPQGFTINHKNGVKTDSRPVNLEYVTRSGNQRHAYATGLMSKSSRSPASLTPDKVIELRNRVRSGPRNCQTYRQLASEFGVSMSQVQRILSGSAWAYLDKG